ncbi:hypothetical protein PQQ87_08665 [Paraburkholderia nemoris]|uniref:hypothetical protein n=1 Tax=Paraburkholderia nemoris TaxID=2793076 RepID=UPI0038BD85F0
MMQSYLAGTAVTVSIPLVDDSGDPIQPVSVSYRVVDQTDTQVVPSTPVPGYTQGATYVSITVPASNNVIQTFSTSDDNVGDIDQSTYGARTIQLTCVDSLGNTTMLAASYVLRPVDILVTGLNSFQSYAQAQLTRMYIANAPGWDGADEDARTAAMIEARDHLVQLNYYLLNTNVNFGQDSLNYIPEGQYVSQYAATNSLFMFNGMLGLLTPEQFSQLPQRFIIALQKAQVAEADYILAPDPIESARQQGLVVDSIGQTKQMFRGAKPLRLPACRKAMSYLSYFLTNTKMIGRA